MNSRERRRTSRSRTRWVCISLGYRSRGGRRQMDHPTRLLEHPAWDEEKALRAVLEVPQTKPFAVGDITIAGRRIEFGAQVADFITIKLTGVATRIGQSTVRPVTACVTSAAAPGLEAVAAMPSVEEAISRGPRTGR